MLWLSRSTRRARSGLVLLVLSALAASAAADIYAGRDEYGVPIYSDRPGEGLVFWLGTNDLPTTSPARKQTKQSFQAGFRRHDAHIRQAAAEHGIEPALLHAVVQVESGYDPRAVSGKGALGLMQLMPATARELGVQDPKDPRSNLWGGARYLRRLIDGFEGNLSLALAAYNAGDGAVRRHGMRIPPFPETRTYVEAVLRRYRVLGGSLAAG